MSESAAPYFLGLARLLEELEDEELEIAEVTSRDGEALFNGALGVDLSVQLPFLELIPHSAEATLTPTDACISEEGDVLIECSVTVQPSDSGPVRSSSSTDSVTSTEERGSSENTEEQGTNENTEGVATESKSGAGDDPAYRDPENLREVYDEYDTFAEMTDALGVFVTPETVRRYMIEYGIHDPRNYSGSSDNGKGSSEREEKRREESVDGAATEPEEAEGASQTEADAPVQESERETSDDDVDVQTLLPEDLEIPSEIALGDVKGAVRNERTIHEVGDELGVERECARRILKGLNLLDLVSGRVLEADREVTPEEIDDRIQTAKSRA